MCVENLRTGTWFSKTIDLRGDMPRFTLKMNIFPSISLETPLNVCWNPQNRDWFSEDDLFKGSHAQVYTKSKCFPIYLLGNPIYVCWNPQNRDWFSETITLRGHMQRCTLKRDQWTFSHVSPWKPLKCVLKPSEQGLIFLRWSIWGVTCPRCTLKMNIFPSIFLETP